jgi:hypothetical protein
MRRALLPLIVLGLAAGIARADAVHDALAALDAAAPGDARIQAAQKVIAIGDVAALAAALNEKPTAKDAQLREILKKIGADVPSAKGVFTTPPRPNKPDAPELDWLAALAKLPAAPATDPAIHDAIDKVTLLRALAATHTPAAAQAILDFGFTADGLVFRDECGRQIRAMSPYSLSTLLKATQDKKRDGGGWSRYAYFQLDKMGKSLPSYCLSAAPNDDVEVEMLHAIRDVKHPDAVSAVLDRANAESHAVRAAAREAWMAYVTGPPPPPAPKEFRKLPGGKLSPKPMPLYLTYRELADEEIRRVLAAQTGTTPPEKATVDGMTKELFELYDNQRATMWDADMKAAADLGAKGDFDGMVAKYDAILGADPLYARRGEMAAGYLEAGKRAGGSDKAILLFHKAYSVDPSGAHAAEAHDLLERSRAARGGAPVKIEPASAPAPAPASPASKPAAGATPTAGTEPEGESRNWMLIGGGVVSVLGILLAALGLMKRRAA